MALVAIRTIPGSNEIYCARCDIKTEFCTSSRPFSRKGAYNFSILNGFGRNSSSEAAAARFVCSISPFTEKDSVKRMQGGGCKLDFRRFEYIWNNESRVSLDSTSFDRPEDVASTSDEQNDIAARLPELREVLGLLRKQREEDVFMGKTRKNGPGNVFLVGTGPGDPELVTVKAVRLMQTADLVLYDRLVSTDILDMVHAGAKLLYVGKTSGYHSRTQDEIHELLLSFAEAGATVLRLKGGDPLVFGRGGEELEFLQEQGIGVTVVPGITAASGIAAELGIPLTHRGVANSVRFLTGHARKGGKDPLYVAEQAADPDSTLIVYMGLATLPALAEKFIANGLPPSTPAAAVERGTTEQQRTVFAQLVDLPSRVAAAQLVSPTLIVIGQVVSLSPLWPQKISVTRELGGSDIEPRDRSCRAPDPLLPSHLN